MTTTPATPPAAALLEVDGLVAHYGDFQALYGVDLRVGEGEAVAVIGANGAGKSTLLKAVAGLVRPTGGEVRFAGALLNAVPAHRRLGMGVSLVPEGRRIFPSLSVEENLLVGAARRRPGPWDAKAVFELFPIIARRAKASSARLSGGEQQALAIGRALMANPRLLLLDEVSLGLAPVVVKSLYEAMPAVRAGGATVVVVEQDVGQAMAMADRVYCLLEGRVSLQGAPAALSREEVSGAYFGM